MSVFDASKYFDEAMAQRESFLRYCTFGNAGGAVATLSLIGTSIGSSANGTYPSDALEVLIVFLSGLGAAGVARFLSYIMAVRVAASASELLMVEDVFPPRQRGIAVLRTLTLMICAGALAKGVFIGMVLLGTLAK